eukprot:scaffold45487_cov40-Attheya_sp.AAC.1
MENSASELIQKVEAQIKKVEAQIERVEAQIENVEKQIDSEENAVEKQQLREKEKQLRTKEEQLRTKKKQLNDRLNSFYQQQQQQNGCYSVFSILLYHCFLPFLRSPSLRNCTTKSFIAMPTKGRLRLEKWLEVRDAPI